MLGIENVSKGMSSSIDEQLTQPCKQNKTITQLLPDYSTEPDKLTVKTDLQKDESAYNRSQIHGTRKDWPGEDNSHAEYACFKARTDEYPWIHQKPRKISTTSMTANSRPYNKETKVRMVCATWQGLHSSTEESCYQASSSDFFTT
ncbi:hypothetical protein AC249_AIPGENE5280 [Exaiptasia diaphana]|nr:hypothetical protein AC249_AIPGENE5280 [Exaiptasia diaphana]